VNGTVISFPRRVYRAAIFCERSEAKPGAGSQLHHLVFLLELTRHSSTRSSAPLKPCCHWRRRRRKPQ